MLSPIGRRIVTAALLTAVASKAHAQGTARSQDIDTSIRAVGMGGTSAGVTWGDPNVWGNPASLGRVEGFRFEHGHTQLVPGLATDVFLDSDRACFGAHGVGVALMGLPSGVGGLRLSYGSSEVTDAYGIPIGTFDSEETVHAASIGVSFAGVRDALRARRGAAPGSSAWDVSGGLSVKRVRMSLAPVFGTASATTVDVGVLGRLSPLVLLPAGASEGAWTRWALFDLGAGYSVLDANHAVFDFGPGGSAPPTRMHRLGGSARAGIQLPPVGGDPWVRAIVSGFSPLVAVGYARDHDAVSAAGTNHGRYRVEHEGVEISVANVFTWRHGYWTDRLGDIVDDTSGYGYGFTLGPWAGFRRDHASMPQATDSGLPRVKRDGWTAWLDVMRVVHDLRGPSMSTAPGAGR